MTPHSPLPHAKPADVGLCPDRTQRLMDVLRREVESGRLPGAVAMIARRGQIALLEAVGQQDPATGTPMQTDSIFRIYSMTKPVVSVAVMMLVERGQLLLSDPVSRWLPEFANQQVATAHGLEPVRNQDSGAQATLAAAQWLIRRAADSPALARIRQAVRVAHSRLHDRLQGFLSGSRHSSALQLQAGVHLPRRMQALAVQRLQAAAGRHRTVLVAHLAIGGEQLDLVDVLLILLLQLGLQQV